MADADPKIPMATQNISQISPESPSMSLRRKLLFGALAAAVLIVGGTKFYDWLTLGRFTESTDNAYIEADIAVIAPKIQGYVREVRVQDNQPVKRGDILAVLDDSEYRAKLAQAEAAVATGQASIDNIGATSAKQQSAIAEAAASIDSKRAEQVRTAADLKRFGQLRQDQWVSAQRLQSAQADADKSRADVAGARAGWNNQQAQLKVLGSQAKIALAYYKQQVAALQSAQLDVDSAILRAPVDGVVGNRAVRVGQFARPGTILMAVVPLTQAYVVANFKETQLQHIRVGQHVSLKVDAYGGAMVDGVVESIAPAAGSRFSILPAENATGNFTKIVQRLPVKIKLTHVPVDFRLTPGMSVEASINTHQRSE
jgi:membrane fusion protein, multidrug efflux system